MRNKPHVASLIETPAGPMTRRQASEFSGIPFGTICRRVWEKCPVHLLFGTKNEVKGQFQNPRDREGETRPRYVRVRSGRISNYSERDLTETWAERKARRARERENVL